MMRALLALALLATPAFGQTKIEAAASNVQLAMQICLQNYHDPQTLLQTFTTAGFSYAPEDFGGGDILHWFYDPGETIQAAIVVDGASIECRIGTSEWGVEQMVPFAQAAFANITNGITINVGSPEGQNILPGSPNAATSECSGFNVFLPRVLLWATVTRQGNDGTCVSDGTSVLNMKF